MATTSVSLVREHTERIRPPRALWVPFEFGRPLGVPRDAAFQRAVVRRALGLLSSPCGPVLEDYEVEAPAATAAQLQGWACPLPLPEVSDEPGSARRLAADFRDEMGRMRTWYDAAVETRGFTTVGASGVAVEALAEVICDLLAGVLPQPAIDVPVARWVNLVADDIRAVYAEALTAQPGQDAVGAERLADWFYGETAAGRALYGLRADNDDGQSPLGEIAGALSFPARLTRRP